MRLIGFEILAGNKETNGGIAEDVFLRKGISQLYLFRHKSFFHFKYMRQGNAFCSDLKHTFEWILSLFQSQVCWYRKKGEIEHTHSHISSYIQHMCLQINFLLHIITEFSSISTYKRKFLYRSVSKFTLNSWFIEMQTNFYHKFREYINLGVWLWLQLVGRVEQGKDEREFEVM